MAATYTLVRHGNFQAYAMPGTPHCGLKDGPVEFKYECKLCVGEDALDKDGFIVDNAQLQEVWKKASTLTISCEKLCYYVARELYRLLGERHTKCKEVCVRIWGIDTAYAEYCWKKDDEVVHVQAHTRKRKKPVQAATAA